MKYIPLIMVRENMEHIPVFSCPDGYNIRTFAKGDEQHWAEIEMLAGEFSDHTKALQQFEREFGPFLNQMEQRCFFLENSSGNAIGTTTAWYGDFEGEAYGRIHWVAIVPAYQGKKLSKPLLSMAMARLSKNYTKAYLTTQTTSYPAINLYLEFGFVPYLKTTEPEEGWQLMEETLKRKLL